MEVEQILDAEALLQKTGTSLSDFVEPSILDAGNLLVMASDVPGGESVYQTVQKLANELMKKLFTLPTEEGINGPLIKLPTPQMKIPREKHVPVEKPETRWEAFARKKGIKKKKKERKVWDPNSQTWKPLYGKNSLKNTTKDWIVEHNPNKLGDYEDPFTQERAERQKVVEKQKKSQLANRRRAAVSASREVVGNGTSTMTIGTMSEISRPMSKKRLESAIQRIQSSTSSMGMFDKKVKGDVSQKSSKKILPANKEGEKKTSERVLRRVNREYEERNSLVNVNKMANQVIRKKLAKRTKEKQDQKTLRKKKV